MLSLDMDGTTLDSQKKVPTAITDAILALQSQGIFVVVGSGRGLCELVDYRKSLKGIDYGILLSGGLIYDFRREVPLLVHAIPTDTVLTVIEIARQEDAMLQLMTTRESAVSERDIERMPEMYMGIYQDMYRRVCTRITNQPKFAEQHAHDVVKINLYHTSPESCARTIKRLAALDLTVVHAEGTGCEANLLGITKGTGLKDLCAKLGIPLEETVAIGDAENDLDIMKTAGLAVAMGNATAAVKAIAHDVVSDNDHEGVLEAIKKYFPSFSLSCHQEKILL
ncbi:MAG: HAD family hydrolase [Selenomonadaceae bacterium]|nr:HAD family hydrolase [Selenomonadaceae bacterium]